MLCWYDLHHDVSRLKGYDGQTTNHIKHITTYSCLGTMNDKRIMLTENKALRTDCALCLLLFTSKGQDSGMIFTHFHFAYYDDVYFFVVLFKMLNYETGHFFLSWQDWGKRLKGNEREYKTQIFFRTNISALCLHLVDSLAAIKFYIAFLQKVNNRGCQFFDNDGIKNGMQHIFLSTNGYIWIVM